ncbi:hypothetical protein Q31b_42060 [Novipirellula aureliae]|uniref:Uncharacterized protein n=1 Tax=Novipirellula aureliae TaxID=2527966 RepID=A0A5C6DP96_9BACT|nr:hypothetical protein [Novipirellula aureliae]TWU39123.1 hypothetical protein Q31b_42060 [Novipirellula aureliae]
MSERHTAMHLPESRLKLEYFEKAITTYLEVMESIQAMRRRQMYDREMWLRFSENGHIPETTHRVAFRTDVLDLPSLPPEIFDFIPEYSLPESLAKIDRIKQIEETCFAMRGRDDIEAIRTVLELDRERLAITESMDDILRTFRSMIWDALDKSSAKTPPPDSQPEPPPIVDAFKLHCEITPGSHRDRAIAWKKLHPFETKTITQLTRKSERLPYPGKPEKPD